MSIKFVCTCGKRLRARDDMAARRSVCPRCGAPVGIPSLQPTHAGTDAGPMTPGERLRRAQQQAGPERQEGSSPSPLLFPLQPLIPETPATPEVPRRRRRIPRQLETHWYQCALFPFRAWRLVGGMAMVLTVFTSTALLIIPKALPELDETRDVWLFSAAWLLVALLILGCDSAVLQCVLREAMAGVGQQLPWPGRNFALIVRSGLIWLVSFLAGPVLSASGAVFYWLNCGEIDYLDQIILAELGIVTITYWLLALLATSRQDRLLDANPMRIAALVRLAGHRLVIVAGLVALLVLGHGYLMLTAAEILHLNPAGGVVLLLLCWGSLVAWGFFLFRLLGVWCYRTGV